MKDRIIAVVINSETKEFVTSFVKIIASTEVYNDVCEKIGDDFLVKVFGESKFVENKVKKGDSSIFLYPECNPIEECDDIEKSLYVVPLKNIKSNTSFILVDITSEGERRKLDEMKKQVVNLNYFGRSRFATRETEGNPFVVTLAIADEFDNLLDLCKKIKDYGISKSDLIKSVVDTADQRNLLSNKGESILGYTNSLRPSDLVIVNQVIRETCEEAIEQATEIISKGVNRKLASLKDAILPEELQKEYKNWEDALLGLGLVLKPKNKDGVWNRDRLSEIAIGHISKWTASESKEMNLNITSLKALDKLSSLNPKTQSEIRDTLLSLTLDWMNYKKSLFIYSMSGIIIATASSILDMLNSDDFDYWFISNLVDRIGDSKANYPNNTIYNKVESFGFVTNDNREYFDEELEYNSYRYNNNINIVSLFKTFHGIVGDKATLRCRNVKINIMDILEVQGKGFDDKWINVIDDEGFSADFFDPFGEIKYNLVNLAFDKLELVVPKSELLDITKEVTTYILLHKELYEELRFVEDQIKAKSTNLVDYLTELPEVLNVDTARFSNSCNRGHNKTDTNYIYSIWFGPIGGAENYLGTIKTLIEVEKIYEGGN